MFSHNELYTSLSSAQLAIGLLFGFVPVALTILLRRMREPGPMRGDVSARAGDSDKTAHAATNESGAGTRDLMDLSTMLRAAYYTLGILSARREPVLFWTIVYGVQAVQKIHEDPALLSPAAIRAALDRLQAQGFVQVEHDGTAITDAGRVLYIRIGRLAGASILEGVPRPSDPVAVTRPDRLRGERKATRARPSLSRQHRRRPRLRSRW